MTPPSFTPAPNRAEFRHYTVTKLVDPLRFKVQVAPAYVHLFRVSSSIEPSASPGWLGSIVFGTYADAVAFGEKLSEFIHSAAEAHSAKTASVRAAVDFIYAEYSQRHHGTR